MAVGLIAIGFPWLAFLIGIFGVVSGVLVALLGAIAKQEVGDAVFDPLQSLRQSLFKAQFIPGAEALSEQALEQLKQAGARISGFRRILDEKLSPTELTHTRFKDSAESAYLSLVDQLQEVGRELKGVEALKPEYVEERLQLFSSRQDLSDAEKGELKALQERQALKEAALKRVREILSANERAATEFDRALVAVQEMATGPKLAGMDFESALDQLQEIAARAKKFKS